MDGVKSADLKTMLATHFTLSADSFSTPDGVRMKSREYLLITLGAQNCYSSYGNYSGMNTGTIFGLYKPRDDMNKSRTGANCGSLKHHVTSFFHL